MSDDLPLHDVYAEPALADVLPSALASCGVPGERNRLGLPETDRTVVLLIDGLGWNLLRRNVDAAPFLNGVEGRPIRAGFPTTTASSLASFGTGLPPGRHGVTGYVSDVAEAGGPFNWLRWQRVGDRRDASARVVPERIQPYPTVFERATAAGVVATTVLPREFAGSGLTRATLRGARFVGTVAYGDLLHSTVHAATAGERTLVYCYLSQMDTLGHVYGPGTEGWVAQLTIVDRFVEDLVARLGPDVELLVTADHGMAVVDPSDRIDFDTTPDLSEGVAALTGEARCRYVHAEPGRAVAVLRRWREVLGERAWVGTRDDVVAAGLIGPDPTPAALRRIGDVVAIARGGTAVVRTEVEPRMSMLSGQHGALTDDELLVPLLQV
ncbi:alkaline phosphatase family protein [Prescottella agglutinans]|uniref:Alkaline phosphatase family protein n=1 Tax=Prescottella agglutinans TaxID=1644129 RepID=A0A3S3BR85_9NOCA|nr:nucleotide pyrophosphatase/phosphodiesterase family protein [Prescottella agglutinans]RVW07334.1 alkaline phosphatase family protein [Prescottella agglutinans]